MTNSKKNSSRSSVGGSLRIGVDTGGTFTDVVAVLGDRQLTFKVPSTPGAPALAILGGISRVFDEYGIGLDVRGVKIEVVHGTTVATNALLERKGARTALVTTAGFEDVIEIGRQARPDLYNLSVTRPEPLVPRGLRFGLNERVTAEAEILKALDPVEVEGLVARLERAKVESVAVSLLFSFACPEHERAVSEALGMLGVPVSASHRILPEYREYERTSTVVVNAYLAPRVGRYLAELSEGLDRRLGDRRVERLRVMQSSGGSISAEVAGREPVRTILSGPAGGVVAAMNIARLAGVRDIVTFDMGGTSTDVALCLGGARTTSEAQIDGLPIAIPVLDIHTVGAGGGSIATIDAGGALRVGPESAGADPGPACYGKGRRPTVTDANLALGRFAGGGLLGGEMMLDEKRAAAAIDELAEKMSHASGRKITRREAALGVIDVANANMERALRLVSIERGHDPRRFTMISFGGAGGLHAAALAGALRMPRIIIPAYPGTLSALGVLLADVVKDYSRTVMLTIENGEPLPIEIEKQFRSMGAAAMKDLRAEGFSSSQMVITRTLAMRYRGQSYELVLEAGPQAVASFHRAHRQRYGHSNQDQAVEIVSVQLRAAGLTEKPLSSKAGRLTRHSPRSERKTPVRLGSRQPEVDVFDRAKLKPGASIAAPAIIVEYGSTTLVPPGWSASIDQRLNLILEKM